MLDIFYPNKITKTDVGDHKIENISHPNKIGKSSHQDLSILVFQILQGI